MVVRLKSMEKIEKLQSVYKELVENIASLNTKRVNADSDQQVTKLQGKIDSLQSALAEANKTIETEVAKTKDANDAKSQLEQKKEEYLVTIEDAAEQIQSLKDNLSEQVAKNTRLNELASLHKGIINERDGELETVKIQLLHSKALFSSVLKQNEILKKEYHYPSGSDHEEHEDYRLESALNKLKENCFVWKEAALDAGVTEQQWDDALSNYRSSKGPFQSNEEVIHNDDENDQEIPLYCLKAVVDTRVYQLIDDALALERESSVLSESDSANDYNFHSVHSNISVHDDDALISFLNGTDEGGSSKSGGINDDDKENNTQMNTLNLFSQASGVVGKGIVNKKLGGEA